MVRRRSRGMTLVEVMVALLVATVGLLGGLAMIGALMNGTSFSRHQSEAAVLAQSKLEELQSTATASFPLDGTYTDGGNNALLDANGHVNTDARYGIYTRTVTWLTQSDPVGTRKLITVLVSWEQNAHSVRVQGVRIP
jgi:prepilin-type N-terminal cleavage/methylation domain-containing protein